MKGKRKKALTAWLKAKTKKANKKRESVLSTFSTMGLKKKDREGIG